MKATRTVVLGLVAGLVVSSFGMAAQGASKPGKKKKKLVSTSLYLHGNAPVGEAETALNLSDGVMPYMDKNKPTSPVPSSRKFAWAAGNTECSGQTVFFPTWVGNLNGKIVGDAKLVAHFANAPSSVTARLWTDVTPSSCNESYVPAHSEVTVDIPAGHNEATFKFKNVNRKAVANVMVELLTTDETNAGRVLYDSTDMASVLKFQCAPARGKSCTP